VFRIWSLYLFLKENFKFSYEIISIIKNEFKKEK